MSKPNSKEHVDLIISLLKQFEIIVTEKEKAEMLSFLSEEQVNRYKMRRIKEKLYND